MTNKTPTFSQFNQGAHVWMATPYGKIRVRVVDHTRRGVRVRCEGSGMFYVVDNAALSETK